MPDAPPGFDPGRNERVEEFGPPRMLQGHQVGVCERCRPLRRGLLDLPAGFLQAADEVFQAMPYRFVQQGHVSHLWQPADVLEMATRNGAAVLGMAESLGSITVGQLADLAIIDTRHAHLTPCVDALGTLVHNGTGRDVEHVIVAGRLVVENHRSVFADESEILARAEAAARAVWARCEKPLRAFPHAAMKELV